jgi:hypothetical protein
MLSVVVLLVVGGMYLAVNAKLARAGREVLSLQSQRADLQRSIAELSANLAGLESPELMLARASSLGFKPASPADVDYVVVPGYADATAFVPPRPPASNENAPVTLSPAYTETLGEWLTRWLGGAEAPR